MIRDATSNEALHTPGPWVVERDGWRYQRIYGKDARVPGESRYIAEVSLDFDGAEANALLMAASPALLEACQKALEWAEANKQRAGTLDVERLKAAVLLATEGRNLPAHESGQSFVAQVPYHCDRIVWRGNYFHLHSLLPNEKKKHDHVWVGTGDGRVVCDECNYERDPVNQPENIR